MSVYGEFTKIDPELDLSKCVPISKVAKECNMKLSGMEYRCRRKEVTMYKVSHTDPEKYIYKEDVPKVMGRNKNTQRFKKWLPALKALLEEGELNTKQIREELNKQGADFTGSRDIVALTDRATMYIKGFYEREGATPNSAHICGINPEFRKGIDDDGWAGIDDDELDRQILAERAAREKRWLLSLEEE